MREREEKQTNGFGNIFLNFVDDGEAIEAEIIQKTEQETVPNIFIKQQHMGLILFEFSLISFSSRRWM